MTHVSVPPSALTFGGVIFWFTVAVAVVVHPLAEVTTTVYVPGTVIAGSSLDEAKLFGPVQAYD